MKTILALLAGSALFSAGAALACDDLSHHPGAQAKAPEASVVIADKTPAPQVAKKPAKQKAPAKAVAQAPVSVTPTAAN